jgi:hypothetical protein
MPTLLVRFRRLDPAIPPKFRPPNSSDRTRAIRLRPVDVDLIDAAVSNRDGGSADVARSLTKWISSTTGCGFRIQQLHRHMGGFDRDPKLPWSVAHEI